MTEATRPPDLLEDRARQLAAHLTVHRRSGRARKFRRRLARLRSGLRNAVVRLGRAPADSSTAIAAEWLLDNEYLVLRAAAQVSVDLSRGFFKMLPKVEEDGGGSRTRVEALARVFLEASDGFVDVHRLQRFVQAFQSVTALDIGEVWAVPAFLRLIAAEHVVTTAESAARSDVDPHVNDRMAAAVGSLRVLDDADWKQFFESISIVDRFLRLDPKNAYAGLDFDTRNRYRSAVEEIARWGRLSEATVAKSAIASVKETGSPLGSFLIGRERQRFEKGLRCRPPPNRWVVRVLRRHAGTWYFGGLSLATLGALLLLLNPVVSAYPSTASGWMLVVLLLALVPAMSLAVAFVNQLATRLVRPRRLPRLDFSEAIPRRARTLAAVPALLTDADEVAALLRQLERNYLGNVSDNLPFALVADPPDADQSELPEDERLLALAAAGIRRLNERYRTRPDGQHFALLTRDRKWNPAEQRWMAWERKRGKLHQLNRLLLGQEHSGLRLVEGDPSLFADIRYVLALDADTFLPEGAAARLIGTLAHPLNTPRFDARGRVEEGYTVLQPRVETLSDSVHPTWFSRIYQASDGFDLYSHAASDVYQDLFGEGIFAGKGLYDVGAFERSLAGRVPENALLSHDLFEGVHGRAGLVSDVTVIEAYPSHPMAYMRRLHRWVRGDWQIAPWLLRSVPSQDRGRLRNDLSPLDRWKIFDNLRRSLVAVSLILLTVVGWWWLPGSWWWSAVPFVVLGAPIFLPEVVATAARARSPRREAVFQTSADRTRWATLRWLTGVVFLPWQAAVEADAIVRTLYRLSVSHRHLLQWTTAAATARHVAVRRQPKRRLGELTAAWSIPLAIGVAGALTRTMMWTSQAPLLLAWLLAPALATATARRISGRRKTLDAKEIRRLRMLARRTWAYFDRLVSAQDHWLPPDNLQLHPAATVARRTSPTNIGLGMLAQLVGSDLGFVPPSRLAAALASTLDTLDRLEKHRGHLLNWYDTRHVRPLLPRYVSVVDSGNLAACAITIGEGLRDLPSVRLPCSRYADAIVDALEILAETLERFRTVEAFRPNQLPAAVRALAAEVREVRLDGRAFSERLAALANVGLPTVETEVAEALESGVAHDASSLGTVREWVRGLDRQVTAIHEELEHFVPWLHALREPPGLYVEARESPVEQAWRRFLDAAPSDPPLRDIPAACDELARCLEALDGLGATTPDPDQVAEAHRWTAYLSERLHASREATQALLNELEMLRSRLGSLVWGMDFRFLYDSARKLLHVGYHVDAATLDRSHYDLYASEARLASFIAIAKGDVPAEHWMYLGRPFARREGTVVLLSWAGTMFEYLMPSLFFRNVPGSLADVACRRAVDIQIRYGQRIGIPWGVSESGFHQTDPHNLYRYRAFGVGALGVRWDATSRIVSAPYASALALALAPRATVRNLRRLEGLGMGGALGLYEAADFGARAGLRQPQVVRSFMAHHQGMILAALDNFLSDSALVERFSRDRRIATFEYLLHEAPPGRVRVQAAPSRPRLAAPARFALPPMPPTWTVDPDAFPTPTTVVSNGALSSLVTANGSGGLRWRGRDVLRWRPDPTAQGWGAWLYVRDVESNRVWSAALAPTWVEPERYDVVFGAGGAQFHREDSGIAMRTFVTVATPADVEIRQVNLTNAGRRLRTLELTSYAEVALADPAEDRRHPAFSKLFVEGKYASRARALLLERRVRGEEAPIFLGHAITSTDSDVEPVGWQIDRDAFMARGGSLRHPPGVAGAASTMPEDTAWAPLDPILSLKARVELPPGGQISLAFLTAVADSPGAVLATLDAYRSPDRARFAARQARDRERALLHDLSVSADLLPAFQRLLTAIVFPYHALRRSKRVATRSATPHQQILWSAGVSGDLPVVVLEANDENDPLLDQLVRAQAYWEKHSVRFDLVLVARDADGYAQPIRDHVARLLSRIGAADRLDRAGGVHYLSFGRMADEALRSMRACAALTLVTDGRSLSQHLDGLEPAEPRLPPFVPVPFTGEPDAGSEPVARPADLEFDNGFGGFSSDGGEYLVHVEPGKSSPAPWSNVIANERFGFLTSESGGGFTWFENSGERRLTTWRNDPVTDVPSEVLYLRDEETSRVWSATPSPAPAPAAYQAVHRPGSTTFRHRSHGLDQRLHVFSPMDQPVKVVELTLTNQWSRPRRLTATYFVEWVLGSDRPASGPHVTTEVSRVHRAIFARNPFSPTAADLVAFLGASEPIHAFTCDRFEFLGEEGDFSRPAGLVRIGLEGRVGTGLDPCGALQVHLDLPPGGSRTIRFLLGAERNIAGARSLLGRFRDAAVTNLERQHAEAAWDDLLGRITVKTPEPAMDVLLNRWLLYQAISCRLWGRSGLYQSSGAIGFRDQLQDSLALLQVAPHLPRRQILEAARHQFAEGDVLHWWHPGPSGSSRGVRTRCSDDLVWLPFAVAEYVEATEDLSILDEPVGFLEAPPLGPEEVERYDTFGSNGSASLYQHCVAALERAGARSERGLPLIGSGDWNDALNRVGLDGRGESVWLGWFLYFVETRFAYISERRGDVARASRLRSDAERLRNAIESCAWDGAWYLRATYDDGTPIGTAISAEARIDSLTQSWAVISGGANDERAAKAMSSVSEHLIRPDDRLVLLLTPPFHETLADPGYIRSYPPGVRENGGQYTHAATWVGLAFATMGDGDRAEEVFRLLNPIFHAGDAETARSYRGEPYVTAGDVYGAPPHTGRSGWTWYTGSAAWLFRLGVEGILGLRPCGGGLDIRPCIPRRWAGYEATIRVGERSSYRIVIRNPEGVSSGVARVRLDGQPLGGTLLPLDDDGQAHEVEVVLGSTPGEPTSGDRQHARAETRFADTDPN